MLGIVAILAVFTSSCMTIDKHGVLVIDTPSVVRNHIIIHDEILPYIASVLAYNDPDGTTNPNQRLSFRNIPTVNNMNYDNVVNCQDYALLFYALCQYYEIPCKLVGNPTLLHAYNQIFEGFGERPVDIEPQQDEFRVYVFGMHGYIGNENGIRIRINTHPDNIVMDIEEWNRIGNEGGFVSPADMELFNYVVMHGKLPLARETEKLPLQEIAPHRAAFYQESTGKIIVLNESLSYWLYQSSPNDMNELMEYLLSYVENIGYVVDYNSFSGVEDNPDLAASVRRLMVSKNRNISVTIWNDSLIINIDTTEDGPIGGREYFFMTWNLIKG
jgi:hypothetical protein